MPHAFQDWEAWETSYLVCMALIILCTNLLEMAWGTVQSILPPQEIYNIYVHL